MTELRIGTCSWKYPSWKGLVYSKGKDIDYLREYNKKYSTVEVDQWFWSLFQGSQVKLPKSSDVKEYRDAVAKDFKFTIKVPNSITLTHYYKKGKSGVLEENPYFLSVSLFKEFLSKISPINDMLGPLIFQFEYLNKKKMSSLDRFLELFEEFSRGLPETYIYTVEIRNPNYLKRSYFEFLNKNMLSHVFLQGYWMANVIDVYSDWRKYIDQQKTVVIRLHGSGREDIENKTGKNWDRIVDSKDGELYNISKMISNLISRGIDVYVNINNHYEGSAPLTIDRLEESLQQVTKHRDIV